MALYAYIAADGSRKVVDSVNLAFTGPWSGSTSYQPFDVADDGQSHKWVALIANTNTPIPTTFDTTAYSTWAHLVQLDSASEPYTPVPGDWLNDVWAGTNYSVSLFGTATAAADQAYSLAQQALEAAWAGTNQPALDAVYTIAVTALETAWVGTDAAGAAAAGADQAYSLAQQALNAAWAGTNQPALDSVYTIAVTALNTAWAGTDAAASAQATADAALAAAQSQLSSGTVPSYVAVNGTIAYNFAGDAYQFTTVDKNLFVTGTNMQAVKEIAVVLKSTGSTYSLAYDGNFQFFGATPPSTIGSKDVMVALTSTGNTLSSVIAASSTAV